jgi:hypothetical protein
MSQNRPDEGDFRRRIDPHRDPQNIDTNTEDSVRWEGQVETPEGEQFVIDDEEGSLHHPYGGRHGKDIGDELDLWV